MYRCESWTIEKVEHLRIDAFELQCWRRLLGVPWTARKSNQSILKEINYEYSLEGLTRRTGEPGILQSMGSLKVRCDSATEQQYHGKQRSGPLFVTFQKPQLNCPLLNSHSNLEALNK